MCVQNSSSFWGQPVFPAGSSAAEGGGGVAAHVTWGHAFVILAAVMVGMIFYRKVLR